MTERTSFGRLGAPGPDGEAIKTILHAANTVPDHGCLQPYRFIVLTPQGRDLLGQAFADAVKRQKPESDEGKWNKAKAKAHAAPTTVLIVLSPKEGKIPLWEQAATAAASGYAITLAAEAMGFGAIWKSIGIEIDSDIRKVVGLSERETILGWINMGTKVLSKTTPLSKKERVSAPVDFL